MPRLVERELRRFPACTDLAHERAKPVAYRRETTTVAEELHGR